MAFIPSTDGLEPAQKDMIAVVQAEFERCMDSTIKGVPANVDPDLHRVMISQNVIRLAIEATANCAAPFTTTFVEELAVRVASYIISIAPDDQHTRIVNRVRKALPAAHAHRMRHDIRIKSTWREERSKN